jgi:hypothetical protein
MLVQSSFLLIIHQSFELLEYYGLMEYFVVIILLVGMLASEIELRVLAFEQVFAQLV